MSETSNGKRKFKLKFSILNEAQICKILFVSLEKFWESLFIAVNIVRANEVFNETLMGVFRALVLFALNEMNFAFQII